MSIRKRFPTAVVLLTLVFVIIQFFSKWSFFVVLQAIIFISLLEFYNLARKRDHIPRRIFGIVLAVIFSLSFYFSWLSLDMALFACLLISAFYFIFAIKKVENLTPFPPAIALTLFGVIYISFTLNYFYLIREEWGPYYVYFLMGVIFLGDTGAYAFGKLFGKHKMTPIASPNKTWEGSIGGIISGCAGGILAYLLLLKDAVLWKVVLFAFIIHFVAQVSDPVESLFKRASGVKDSSNLLPGHGGFLDRIDSFILAAPLFYYLLKFIGVN